MKRHFAYLILPTTLAFASTATAQRILVPESSNDAVMEFDAMTGALVNATFMDLTTLTSGAVTTPIEIIEAPNGELWVSDQGADAVFRFSGDGTTFLGQSTAALDNVRGLASFGAASALVSNSGTGNLAPGDAIVEVDAAGASPGFTVIGDPFDVEPYTFNGVAGYLVTDIAGEDLVFVDGANLATQSIFHDSDGVSGIDFPEQVHVGISGNVFAGGFTAPSGIYEYDGTGAQIDFIDTVAIGALGGIRGVVELGNGNLLFTNGAGVHVYDRVAGTITTEIMGVSARFGTLAGGGGGLILTNYCTAVPNSTGVAGVMSAFGSSIVANNDVTIVASNLPPNQFGIFVTSRMQGFVPMTGGQSNGNLCVGGTIGRFVGPGQIVNSGAGGTFSITIDLTAIPEGGMFATVMPGDDWNFQAWFRDGVGAGSNLTDGIEVSFN